MIRGVPAGGRRSAAALIGIALASALAVWLVLALAPSPADAHVPVCTVNSVGGRVVCHANVSDDNLHAKAVDTSGFCPSDYWRVAVSGTIANTFASGVCDTGARNSSNFFCIGCRPTNISVDNNYPTPVGTRYAAWHD